MNDNVQDLDYTVNRMFNSDGTRKVTRDENAYNLSVNRPMVKNRRTKKKKAMGIKEIATKTIILVALSAGLTVGIHELHEAMEVGENAKENKNELGASVTENTEIAGYNKNEQRPYWWYQMDNVASDVLNSNKEYDIDTRIYGCFRALNEYEKESYMNELFSKMSRIIASNPASYSEDEIKSALHSSFQDYLDSKNITLEEYEELMDKVIKAYAKEDKSEEEVASLLSKLNDAGTRDGGSR